MATDRTSLAAMALDAWGADAQIVQAMEEAGELIVALSHWRRERGEAMDLATEVADLEIMLEQVALILRRHDGDGSTLEAARRQQRAKALASVRSHSGARVIVTPSATRAHLWALDLAAKYEAFATTVRTLGGDPELACELLAAWHLSGGTKGMSEADIIEALRGAVELPEVPA